VPQQGIARDAKGDASAMVVNGDGVVERRPVVVSDTFEGNWLVKDGLHPGDRVVVAGLQKIAPGAEVHVTDITGD
jgi:membrane fusion protein (multidrug efflux system)